MVTERSDQKSVENTEASGRDLRELPFEMRLKVYSASLHDLRMDILLELAKKSPQSFTELEEKFRPRLNPNTMTYHLSKLQEAGLIKNELVLDKQTRRYSNYSLTKLGREVAEVDDLTTIL